MTKELIVAFVEKVKMIDVKIEGGDEYWFIEFMRLHDITAKEVIHYLINVNFMVRKDE